MPSITSSSSMLALICIVALLSLLNYNQVAGKTVSANERDAASSDGIDLFPWSPECKQDEYPAFGILPTCEPTCKDKRPICKKIFDMTLDYVPCFCKRGLFRDTESGKCVSESQCKP